MEPNAVLPGFLAANGDVAEGAATWPRTVGGVDFAYWGVESLGTDAVTLNDGRQLLVYNPTTSRPDGKGGPRSPLDVAVSNDGLTWTNVAVLETDAAPNGYSYPAVIQTRDGLVHITYTWRREKIRHMVIDPAKLSP